MDVRKEKKGRKEEKEDGKGRVTLSSLITLIRYGVCALMQTTFVIFYKIL